MGLMNKLLQMNNSSITDIHSLTDWGLDVYEEVPEYDNVIKLKKITQETPLHISREIYVLLLFIWIRQAS